MPGRKMGAFAEGDQRATKRLIDPWVKGLAIRLRMLLESVARVFRIRVRGGHDAPAMMPIIETYREHIAALFETRDEGTPTHRAAVSGSQATDTRLIAQHQHRRGGMTLITAEWKLANAYAELGGEVRFIPLG